MYSIKVCDAVIGDAQPRLTTKQLGKGIARATLKHIPHDTYLAMFWEGQQKILSNKRIGSKLHFIYTMNVQNRGFVPYDDKHILLADLPAGQQNPDTHAFGHYSLEAVRMPSPNSRRPVRKWSSWFDQVEINGMKLNWFESTLMS